MHIQYHGLHACMVVYHISYGTVLVYSVSLSEGFLSKVFFSLVGCVLKTRLFQSSFEDVSIRASLASLPTHAQF